MCLPLSSAVRTGTKRALRLLLPLSSLGLIAACASHGPSATFDGGPSTGGMGAAPSGGRSNATGSAGGSAATAGAAGASGGAAGTGGTVACVVPADASTRREAPYPTIDAKAGCGSWALVDNVCCAQYCNDDTSSESCDQCGGPGSARCVAASSKGCVSGQWPEVHCVGDNEPWHASRSTHFGLTNGGACAFGFYGLCTTGDKFRFTDPKLKADCEAFCKAYPDLCADPAGISLRGNFAAPQGNYYTQFWPSLEGDRDNYLSCGECFQVLRTKPDGSEYVPGDTGYTPPIVLQVVDSCPCSANSKWCCGSGRDHCGEVKSSALDFAKGCPLDPGNLPADHDPQVNESIHLDLSDIAMARLQSGDPNKGIVEGVIPTKYKRVACPVVGNIYVWMRQGGEYYFQLSVVNVKGLGSVTKVEAQLESGEWSTLVRDPNYTSARPQERFGTWVVKQGEGPFALPLSLRITDPSGQALEAKGVIKAWPSPTQQDGYYADTGVQF